MIENVNIRHLLAVSEAARRGTLGKAAAAINLSQPATTQAIRKLEAWLGEPVFERTSTGLNPTNAGQIFIRRIDRAFGWLNLGQRVLSRDMPPLTHLATSVQLRAISAVVENGSYSLAARRLGVSQPSVHRAARDFERLCGQTLFLSSPQGLEPTPAARELARCAALAAAEITQGVEEIREARGIVDGRVWIGCLPLARTQLLPEAVTRLLLSHPAVKVRIHDGAYSELLYALRHGQIDLIIGALRQPAPSTDTEQQPLFSDPLSIVVRAGHPVLQGPPPDAAQLASLSWVVSRDGTPAREQFNAFFHAQGVQPPTNLIECSSLIAVRGLLLRSDRAGILSAAQVHYELEAGQLRAVSTPLPGTDRPIGLTTRKNWQPTTAQAKLIEIVRGLVQGGMTPALKPIY